MRLVRSLSPSVQFVVAVLVLTIVAVGTLTPDDHPRPVVTASPRPVPTPAGFSAARDVSSRPNGTVAVLGQTCIDETCSVWVRWSRDGARSFASSGRQVLMSGPRDQPVDRILLGADGHAWAWGPHGGGDPSTNLFWTTDEGRTWNRTRTIGYADVQLVGDDAWYLRATCEPRCSARLAHGKPGANPDAAERLTLPEDEVPLVLQRRSETEAFLVTRNGSAKRLWRTTDGARTWRPVGLPPPCPTWQVVVAALPTSLWLECVGQTSAGSAPSALWRSTDGSSWTRLPQPPELRDEPVLTLVDDHHALITSGAHAGVLETTDAGTTWDEVLPVREAGYGPVRQSVDGTLFVTAGTSASQQAELVVRRPFTATWASISVPS